MDNAMDDDIGVLGTVQLTPPSLNHFRQQSEQEGFLWGRCFKRLAKKSSACICCISLLTAGSCPVGMYFITTEVIGYKNPNMHILLAATLADLTLLGFTLCGTAAIVKIFYKAIKQGCANQNRPLLSAQIM